jgi:hypothetical protein
LRSSAKRFRCVPCVIDKSAKRQVQLSRSDSARSLRDVGGTRTKVLKPREGAVFAALTDAYCSPVPALPPVGESDAVAFADELVAASPSVNRIGFRVILRLVDLAPLVRGYSGRFRLLSRAQRDEFLHGLDRSRWFLLRTAARLLKTVTLMSYYGDPEVLRKVGYDPDANLARGRALRTREGRQ